MLVDFKRYMSKGYPDLNDPEFYNKINKIYKSYKISDEKKTLREICFPDSFQYQIPQEMLAHYINPKTPYKSILIYHRIGAGKTCTAINIAEQWKEIGRAHV